MCELVDSKMNRTKCSKSDILRIGTGNNSVVSFIGIIEFRTFHLAESSENRFTIIYSGNSVEVSESRYGQ